MLQNDHEHEVTYVGHYPNTKHHIQLQMYRDEQNVSRLHNVIFSYCCEYALAILTGMELMKKKKWTWWREIVTENYVQKERKGLGHTFKLFIDIIIVG